jgi:DNA-binding NtrC family response regulator
MDSVAEKISESATRSVRVLIVDDDSVLARALQRVLRANGLVADAVLDGRSAIERLRAEPYDVMLLDLQMANMDGMEVYRLARGQSSPPATIIHSAHVDVRTAVLAIRAGVQEVMQKPVPEQILTARIRELAAERRAGARRLAVPEDPVEPPDALMRLVGESTPMTELRRHVCRVANFRDLAVMIQGPTGTGKELVALAIHAASWPAEPFVSVNCAAVPEHLFESELFGHEAGAFTNAKASRVGLFEEAGRGTLFLDEIGEMPFALQAKLLRVLETRQFRRVGGNRSRLLAARVVSATNRSSAAELRARMRPDLYFRLAGYTIPTPPLSAHVADVPDLARHFIEDFGKRHDMPSAVLTARATDALIAHRWPGNVRELRAVMESASVLARDGVIDRAEVEAALVARSGFDENEPKTPVAPEPRKITSIPPPMSRSIESTDLATARSGVRRRPSLPDLQRDMILSTFEQSQRNLSHAARELGIPRSTLRARLRKYGVR